MKRIKSEINLKAVIQRVSRASVSVESKIVGSIQKGYMILLGVGKEDTEEDANWLAQKILNLRIFNDSEGKMNLNLADVEGRVLVISQFTLHAKTKKGNRPSYIHAASPEIAIPLYEHFKSKIAELSSTEVESGVFGADMDVEILNQGPVTITIDTKNKE